MGKYIVTIAPPTPNGNLHLGHISGPFLAADVFARLRRMMGDDVLFVSYSDDYQDYVALKAIQQNKDKFELATHFGNRIEATLKGIDIDLDIFLKAYQNEHYTAAIRMLYQNAVKKGTIQKTTMQVPYSEEDQQFGYEAFARGICNYCGSHSDASQCEACANSPVLEKMENMVSYLTNKPVQFVEKEREYLQLEKYKEFLQQLYTENEVRDYLNIFINHILNESELDWCIDRPGGHGIDLEIDGEHKTIHTWFSGIAGYLAASKEFWTQNNAAEKHAYFWKDTATRIVNFLGFDCSFSHAIVYPSLLSNLEGYTNNFTALTNKFLKLEGGDFSTSRNHAIWVDDILKDYSADGVRFHLALISPEKEIRNFEMLKFTHWYTNFFERGIQRIESVFEAVTDIDKHITKLQNTTDEVLLNFYKKWSHHGELKHFSINGIASVLQELLEYILKLYANKEADKIVEASILYVSLSTPIHPTLSNQFMEKYTMKNKVFAHTLFNKSIVS
ncbi:class I tRNA ligase family protein [Kordia jejudonensis]|uniref:class I tRNA ligase family protein n=1 Tax=Kordia jejudonensis TaxID=1348245 RepID=UPI00069BFD49|nr:class I tRNA ligase family protein [Kordia jejudonensis]